MKGVFMERKIKVLVITYTSWRNDTNVGNSYSNIFNGMDDRLEFAQLYIRDGMPENKMVHKYFHISEKKLLKSVFTRKPVGEYFCLEDPMSTPKLTFSNSYNKMRKLNWEVFYLARDIACSLGAWKSKALDRFLVDFKPDIIFSHFGSVTVVNQLIAYCQKKTEAKLVLYPWDDLYHINQYNKSVAYRLRSYLERYFMRKCAKSSSFMYTITEQMADEFAIIFNKECKILRKGYDFSKKPDIKQIDTGEIGFVYAGNIGDKRWMVLAEIVKSIQKVSKKIAKNLHLYIYTMSPIDNEMRNALEIENISSLMGAISSQDVPKVLEKSDVLIHVEAFDKAKLETCRSSFSTKLVDYFFQGKCILAVGGQNASMEYLKKHDAAIVVDDIEKIDEVIERIALNPEILNEYGSKAWACGERNHNIHNIQDMIYKDIKALGIR